eukprot:2190972-Pleurochrysis_carterae.AAC.1
MVAALRHMPSAIVLSHAGALVAMLHDSDVVLLAAEALSRVDRTSFRALAPQILRALAPYLGITSQLSSGRSASPYHRSRVSADAVAEHERHRDASVRSSPASLIGTSASASSARADLTATDEARIRGDVHRAHPQTEAASTTSSPLISNSNTVIYPTNIGAAT